jgi:hypothetical protein
MKTTLIVFTLLVSVYTGKAQHVARILAENREPIESTTDVVFTEQDVIQSNALPIAVKERLKSSDFRTLAVTKSYRKVKSGKVFYALDVSNGIERKKIKFDEHGIMLNENDFKLLLFQQL